MCSMPILAIWFVFMVWTSLLVGVMSYRITEYCKIKKMHVEVFNILIEELRKEK